MQVLIIVGIKVTWNVGLHWRVQDLTLREGGRGLCQLGVVDIFLSKLCLKLIASEASEVKIEKKILFRYKKIIGPQPLTARAG